MIFLVWILMFAQAAPPVVCTVPTKRHSNAVKKFHRLTGFPHGRPGYVVDHIIPLCACGPDTVENMQWQTVIDSLYKDIDERAQCRALRATS